MLKCRNCGSTTVEVYYDAAVLFQVTDGKVTDIYHGGVLGGGPREVRCPECDHVEDDRTALSSVEFDVSHVGPRTVRLDALSDDGFYSYGGE